MTEEEMETARAFVACGRWKWLPGMRGHDRYVYFRVVERFHDGFLVRFRNPPSRQHKEHRFWDNSALNPPLAPDITDPCTKGGILQVVRDATGRKYACLEYIPLGCWAMVDPIDGRWLREQDYGASEAEALLIALQAAPEAP